MPPFPVAGPRRAAFPALIGTTKALRLPGSNTGSLMDSLTRPNGGLFGSLRHGGRPHRTAWPRSSPVPLAVLSLVDAQELPGSCAAHSMPLPRSAIPAGPAELTLALCQCRPRRIENESTMHWAYRDSITRLQHPLPTLQQGWLPTSRKARFRLVVSLCREGVKPSGLLRKVSACSCSCSCFPLSQACPGAINPA